MDILVKGRNVEVPEHYRQHVAEKLRKIERYDEKLIRVDVELSHERNPRQSDYCQRVEITCASRGPLVRAEACAGDFYTALDHAIAKLDARLRRVADRRRVHRGRRAPVSVAEATSGLPSPVDELFTPLPRRAALRWCGTTTTSRGTSCGRRSTTRCR
jgi:ribosomal subunit interface protein